MDSSHFGSVDAFNRLAPGLAAPDLAAPDLAAPLSSVSSTDESAADRYILTQVGAKQLVFPADWVTEILLLERSQILMLPFYDPMLLGVVHHHGQLMPLVSMWQVLENTAAPTRELLSVVQLSVAADRLAGVGIVVDRALDNRLRQQLPDALFASQAKAPPARPLEQPPKESSQPMQLFRPELLPDRLWQPQRWWQLDPLG